MRLTVITNAAGDVLAFYRASALVTCPAVVQAHLAHAGLGWQTLTLPPRVAATARAGELRALLARSCVRTTHGIPYLAVLR